MSLFFYGRKGNNNNNKINNKNIGISIGQIVILCFMLSVQNITTGIFVI